MPIPSSRKSLTTDLESRYKNQKVGSAFDVKRTLKPPGSSPKAGEHFPSGGTNEGVISVNGFVAKEPIGVTQLLDVIEANSTSSPSSKELSLYMRGFTNRRYKP